MKQNLHVKRTENALICAEMRPKCIKNARFLVVFGLFLGIFGVVSALSGRPLLPAAHAMTPALRPDILAYGRGEGLVFERMEISDHAGLQAVLHVLVIPHETPYQLQLAVAPTLQTIPQFFTGHADALMIINAGYFDPKNAKTISNLKTAQGAVFKASDNERLTGNAALTPYLPAIENRPELRRYECVSDDTKAPKTTRYAIENTHDTPLPDHCTLAFAVGGGPMLLPGYAPEKEGFVDHDETGKTTRDPIGVDAPNARSVVGLRDNGDVVLMMVGEKLTKTDPPGQQDAATMARGLSLPQLAAILKTMHVTRAMNLDGGSSAGVMAHGTMYWGKLNTDGTPVKRPLKSVLLVLPLSAK